MAGAACSWISRGILRDGSFGQHCGLSGHTSQKRLALVNGAACSELLSARAMVDVAGRIILKVAAREGAVISLRLIEHRDVLRKLLGLDRVRQALAPADLDSGRCAAGSLPFDGARLDVLTPRRGPCR